MVDQGDAAGKRHATSKAGKHRAGNEARGGTSFETDLEQGDTPTSSRDAIEHRHARTGGTSNEVLDGGEQIEHEGHQPCLQVALIVRKLRRDSRA